MNLSKKINQYNNIVFAKDFYDVKYYHIFILILIISANYLGQLFPCRFQNHLNNNMILKHVFGFFTLVFFVSFDINTFNSFTHLFKRSAYLYLYFILLTKNDMRFFTIIFILLGIMYMLSIKRKFNEKYPEDIDPNGITNDKIKMYTEYLHLITIVLTILGFTVYLGSKKHEFRKEFNLMTFLLGKHNCRGTSNKFSILESIKYAFTSINK